MVDHHLVVEEIVHQVYANLHQRCGGSFQTWVRRVEIEVTQPYCSWLVDHLPTRTELVECFSEGCPHQMETKCNAPKLAMAN